MILIDIEDMLADLGCTSVSAAATVDQALALIEAQDFDLATLDVNLNGQQSHPVSEALDARSVPFAFATGYGDRGMRNGYRGRPVLKKPFQVAEFNRVLTSLLPR